MLTNILTYKCSFFFFSIFKLEEAVLIFWHAFNFSFVFHHVMTYAFILGSSLVTMCFGGHMIDRYQTCCERNKERLLLIGQSFYYYNFQGSGVCDRLNFLEKDYALILHCDIDSQYDDFCHFYRLGILALSQYQ